MKKVILTHSLLLSCICLAIPIYAMENRTNALSARTQNGIVSGHSAAENDQVNMYNGLTTFLQYVIQTNKKEIISQDKAGRNSIVSLLLAMEKSASDNGHYCAWLNLFWDQAKEIFADGNIALATKQQLLTLFIKKVKHYYTNNHDLAAKFLNPLVDAYIKELDHKDSRYPMSFDWSNFFIIKSLRCMASFEPSTFKHHAANLLENKLMYLVAFILMFTDDMKKFDHTSLSIPNIIKHALREKKLDLGDNLRELFRDDTYRTCLERYKDRIIKLLATEPLNDKTYRAIFALIRSPIKELQEASLHASVNYLESLLNEQQNLEIVNDAFECFLNQCFNAMNYTIIDIKGIVNVLQKLSTKMMETKSYNALLLLWWHLISEPELQTFLKRSMCHYFNVHHVNTKESSSSHLNMIFDAAIKKQSISFERGIGFINAYKKLHSIIKRFGFYDIDVAINTYKLSCLAQEETPAAARCLFLSDLIEESLNWSAEEKSGKYNAIVKCIESLPSSPFKKWATIVIDAHNVTTFDEYSKKRKKLKKLCDDHHELLGNVPLLDEWGFGPWNAFQVDPFNHNLSDIKIISDGLWPVKLDDNLLLGIRQYEPSADKMITILYAFDSDDGHLLWARPLETERLVLSFMTSKKFVYFIDDTQNIIQIDKQDGSIIKSVHIAVNVGIRATFVTQDDFLFVIDGDTKFVAEFGYFIRDNAKVYILNMNKEDLDRCTVVNLPEGCVKSDYEYIANDELCLETMDPNKKTKCLLSINKTGDVNIVDLDASLHTILISGNHMLIYSSCNDQKVIFIDDKGKKLFEYNVNSLVQGIELSLQCDKLYILTSDELIALDINTMPLEPTTLWKTDISQLSITNIIVSDDIIYGLSYYYSPMIFTFDCKTGHQQECLDATRTGALGIHNKKIYISGR